VSWGGQIALTNKKRPGKGQAEGFFQGKRLRTEGVQKKKRFIAEGTRGIREKRETLKVGPFFRKATSKKETIITKRKVNFPKKKGGGGGGGSPPLDSEGPEGCRWAY